MHMPYPLTFAPVYKDYPWGGDMFARRFKRHVPFNICAESWELADRPEGMSIVANGPLRGRTLGDLVRTMGPDLIGSMYSGGPFPLLIKLIDARERLSLQVHPDVVTAIRTGGEPKTEAWFILEAQSSAKVFAGLKEGVTSGTFTAAMESGALEPLLQPVAVAAGDMVFIPGGSVHAIDAGCLLLEVQQNSNTTYRVYDWGRIGPDGTSRPLHKDMALQTIDWLAARNPLKIPAPAITPGGSTIRELIACPFFTLEHLFLKQPLKVTPDPRSFHALFVIEGVLTIQSGEQEWTGKQGTTWLIPAKPAAYTLHPAAATQAIRISLPASATR